jgi:muramidase (phage lysozyme)
MRMEMALKDPEVQRLLHAIRQAEFNSRSLVDKYESEAYWLGYGFVRLDTLEDHPALLNGSNRQQYSGAYQIGRNSWLRAKNAMGLTNFSPHSQDLYAVWIIDKRGQLDNVMSGNWEKALPQLSREWASIPMGKGMKNYHWPQPYADYEILKGHYEHYGRWINRR